MEEGGKLKNVQGQGKIRKIYDFRKLSLKYPRILKFSFSSAKLLQLLGQDPSKLHVISLTLKMPRKPASENVVCLCRLLNILANFSNLYLHTGKQCGPRSDCS